MIVIKVGGASVIEANEKKDFVVDAIKYQIREYIEVIYFSCRKNIESDLFEWKSNLALSLY